MTPKFLPVILILPVLFFCSGCAMNFADICAHLQMEASYFEAMSDDPEQWMEQTMDALIADNPGALKQLFASNVQETDEFDGQLLTLFSFIDGEIESYDIVLGRTSLSTHDGYMESDVGCDIVTTTGSYRLAIKICRLNVHNSNDVGIQSLYVIDSEDIVPDLGYWGSIVWGPGIIIA